jgi:hypothetical protein
MKRFVFFWQKCVLSISLESTYANSLSLASLVFHFFFAYHIENDSYHKNELIILKQNYEIANLW